MGKFKTEQENFWANEFGDEYTKRNILDTKGKIAMFSRIFNSISNSKSLIEFGTNRGMNIQALGTILPNDFEFSGIEINESAVNELRETGLCKNVYHDSILEFEVDYKRDISLISGVLIHINPDELQNVYQKLYDASSKYIIVNEYYNPTPVEISYRGHEGRLFKRDFAGEILDKFDDLELVDYGFCYHRDNNFMFGDSTWFLLKKKV
jgi:pseudaminic acid biosynthesis-associated methylase